MKANLRGLGIPTGIKLTRKYTEGLVNFIAKKQMAKDKEGIMCLDMELALAIVEEVFSADFRRKEVELLEYFGVPVGINFTSNISVTYSDKERDYYTNVGGWGRSWGEGELYIPESRVLPDRVMINELSPGIVSCYLKLIAMKEQFSIANNKLITGLTNAIMECKNISRLVTALPEIVPYIKEYEVGPEGCTDMLQVDSVRGVAKLL